MKSLVLGGSGPVAEALRVHLTALDSTPHFAPNAAAADLDGVDVALVCDALPDALEVCRALLALMPRPLVALVSTAAQPNWEPFLEAGVADVLRWPQDTALWRPRLRALCDRASAQRDRAALEETSEKFRLLFHNELDAISLTDLSTGRFIDVNDPWVALYGHAREDAVGKMGPKDVSAEASATQAAIFRAAESASPCKHVRWHKSKQGVVFPVEIYAGTYAFRGRKVLVAMIRDITERVKLESQLRQADRMASVGTLAAGVAHEINNPLSFVLGNLDYMVTALDRARTGQPLDQAALKDAVEEARDGARRVREIVRDLKTFSRADEVEPEAVDVAQVMDVALRLLGNELRHRAELRRDYRNVPRAWVNDARLGQVFVNLLTNAVQSLPDRPREQNVIEVRVLPGEQGTVIGEVRDTGQGIAPENLQRIFDPFFTTKPIGEGTGLGLSICQTIVNGFGGRLEVESAVGHGSLFRVVLPSAQPHRSAAPVLTTAAQPAAPEHKRLRLLLIDDERNLGLVLGRALEPDVDLQFVTDARDGLKKIASGEAFDAVVCDLMMPSLSGMEFYEELSRVDANLARRTGFITGGTFTPPARDFASRMTGRIIEKPFMAEDLEKLVRALVAH